MFYIIGVMILSVINSIRVVFYKKKSLEKSISWLVVFMIFGAFDNILYIFVFPIVYFVSGFIISSLLGNFIK